MQLSARDVSVSFSGVHAIEAVSFEVARDEIVGLVGPNGAGKTTMINVLTGFQRPTAGRVLLAGEDVTGQSAGWFARHGVVRTFQAVRLFQRLTVQENLEAAFAGAGIGRMEARHRSAALLDYLGLAASAGREAGTLNYGDERRVGIARALALSPGFLLLDEPAAGMNIAEAEALAATIRRIHADYGCGIVLIEHNMRLVSAICDRLHVLASGRTVSRGAPAEVMADPHFREAYLGAEAVA
ncbi:ATP-binding cassette domain-containing protein [Paracoccus sp. S-4012]|uniref:ABC transporter ATP-binding protein n=1 Tax=Paracoccus sp. S-4012 TaxID=2665648 RepID=UPI0012AFC842|nr:ABC transporter ATP-binding protein [Paracoccus sp. S-4012]MRX52277.1 ATP-binding cassette domain-containing protein [Paracoccus sp. S-4012]